LLLDSAFVFQNIVVVQLDIQFDVVK